MIVSKSAPATWQRVGTGRVEGGTPAFQHHGQAKRGFLDHRSAIMTFSQTTVKYGIK
jgi:hypothetical protein